MLHQCAAGVPTHPTGRDYDLARNITAAAVSTETIRHGCSESLFRLVLSKESPAQSPRCKVAEGRNGSAMTSNASTPSQRFGLGPLRYGATMVNRDIFSRVRFTTKVLRADRKDGTISSNPSSDSSQSRRLSAILLCGRNTPPTTPPIVRELPTWGVAMPSLMVRIASALKKCPAYPVAKNSTLKCWRGASRSRSTQSTRRLTPKRATDATLYDHLNPEHRPIGACLSNCRNAASFNVPYDWQK